MATEGERLLSENQFTNALDWFQNAANDDHNLYQVNIHINIAKCYLALKNINSAEHYLRQAQSILVDVENNETSTEWQAVNELRKQILLLEIDNFEQAQIITLSELATVATYIWPNSIESLPVESVQALFLGASNMLDLVHSTSKWAPKNFYNTFLCATKCTVLEPDEVYLQSFSGYRKHLMKVVNNREEYIISQTPVAPVAQVSVLVSQLCSKLNNFLNNDNIDEATALILNDVARIHPFNHSNGKTARLLVNCIYFCKRQKAIFFKEESYLKTQFTGASLAQLFNSAKPTITWQPFFKKELLKLQAVTFNHYFAVKDYIAMYSLYLSELVSTTIPLAPNVNIDTFLKIFKPSVLVRGQYKWISVCASNNLNFGCDYKDIDISCATQQQAYQLAKRLSILSGKWIIRVQSSIIDTLFMQLAKRTYENHLGAAIKTTTKSNCEDIYVVCVYVKDIFDMESIQYVRSALASCECVIVGFKPDIYTVLGIYANHPSIQQFTYK